MDRAVHVEMTRDAAAFLAAAGDHLRADPLVGTVPLGVAGGEARRAASEPDAPVPAEVRWFATVRDGRGEVVGAGMRTAPFAPYPAYVTPMATDAAVALADAVGERDEHPGAVNGSLPAARTVADRLADRLGERVVVEEPHRLHELGDLVMPPAPPGRLRPATAADLDLCLAWFRRFDAEAAEQAGRPPSRSGDHWTAAVVRRRIDDGVTWLWEDADGTPVHLSGATPAAGGVARIAPVYTPPDRRGRGYAARAVAEVAALLGAAGDRVCLFTDLDNPTSNALYARLGFVPRHDIAMHRLVPGAATHADAGAGRPGS